MSERVHELKTLDLYFDAIARGEKLFEVRRNDRFFQAGDTVELVRINAKGWWTDADGCMRSDLRDVAKLRFRIGPILQGGQFGIEAGYCVFSLLDDGTTPPVGDE